MSLRDGWRNHKGWALLSLVIALSLAGVVMANERSWVGAGEPEPLGGFVNTRAKGHPIHSLVVGTAENPAVLWAGPATGQGYTLLLGKIEAGQWVTETLIFTSDEDVWAPEIVYSGTHLIAAWLQGTYDVIGGKTPLGDLKQMDLPTGQVTTIMTDVFGYPDPVIVVAPTGLHMVFTAADINRLTTNGDLYYAYRAPTEMHWTVTQVVTYAQYALMGGGGVRYPRLALNAAGTEAHVVWQQDPSDDTIWYLPGDWVGGTLQWGTATRITATNQTEPITPTEQFRMLRPNVVIQPYGDEESIHIAWVHRITEVGQYVYTCRWNREAARCETPVLLNSHPLGVTDNFPRYVRPAIAAAQGMLCIGWHGFPEKSAVAVKEDIFVRCSQDNGATWQLPINISGTSEDYSTYPELYIDTQRQLHVTWMEFTLVVHEPVAEYIYYRRGASFLDWIFLPIIARGP